MKQIPLTQGKFAIVDDDMFDYLNQWKWSFWKMHGRNYAGRTSNGKSIYMHRQILGFKHKDKNNSDHRDGNGLNNQLNNLRTCTHQQNMWNSLPSQKPTSSRYKGVSWHKKIKKWQSYICYNYKLKYLGYFHKEKEAAKAYNSKAKELFGEFVQLNDLQGE